MDKRKNNKGTLGNRGGRKSAREERLVFEVINKSWERVSENLSQNRLTEREKDMIALEVVKRTAPKNLDLTSDGDQMPTPVLVTFLDETIRDKYEIK